MVLMSTSAFGQQDWIPTHLDNDIRQKMGYKAPNSQRWKIKPIFDFCRPFGNDGTAVAFISGKAGYINSKGKYIISPQFDDAENFNPFGYAIVRKVGKNHNIDAHNESNDLFGAIDFAGRLIIPYAFKELNTNSFPGTFIGRKDKRWGMVDSKARVLLDFKYHMINVHKSGKVAIVRIDSLTAVVDQKLNWITPLEENFARFAGHNLISLKKNGKFGYINFAGDTVIPFEYEQFAVFKNGICIIKKHGYFGMIDTLGKTLIPFEYDGGEPLTNDTAIMMKQGKFGMINGRNEVIVAFIYDKISRFYFPRPPGGFVLIKRDEWFYIDPKTKVITPWTQY